MVKPLRSATILSVGLALSGLFIGQGFHLSRIQQQSVEVKGLAESTIKSNEAIWTLSFRLVNNDLSNLYNGIYDSQTKIKNFLIEQGFSAENISFNPISVTDNQSINYNQNQNIPRYNADMGITLTSNEVDKVAVSIQKTGDLVKQGMVVTSSNVNYRFNDLNTIKPKMLEQATQNARQAAESFAKDSSTHLGGIIHANQGLFSITDANSTFDSGTSIMKKVRIVTSIEYELIK